MKEIGGFITLTMAAGVLLVLSSLWVFKLILKKEKEHYFRGILIFALALVAFLYIQREETRKLTLSDIQNELFPKKAPNFTVEIQKGTAGNVEYTVYLFEEPQPKIPLTLDKNGKYFTITNVSVLNSILRELKLPEVKEGVPELASITGSLLDVNLFRWDDYEPGILLLERSLCRNKDSLETYHCLLSLKVTSRY